MRFLADTLGIGLATAVLYLALLQDALFSVDGTNFYQFLRSGETTLGFHLIGLRIIGVGANMLSVFGLDLLHAASGACALATSIAAMITHRTALGIFDERGVSAAAALLFACLPTTVFFATLIELPSVFAAFCAGSYLVAVRYCARPTAAMAMLIGVTTALAALVHATGQMLPLCIATFVAGRVQWLRRSIGHGIVLLITHAVVSITIAGLVTGFGHQSSAGTHLLGQLERLGNLRELPDVLLRVYAIPLFPASVVMAAIVFGRRWRRPALWMHLAVLGIAVFSALILGGIREHGRYFALITVPVSLIAAQALGSAWRIIVAAALGLTVGVTLVWQHEAANAPTFTASDVAQALGDKPALVMVGDATEMLPVLTAVAHHDAVDLVNFLGFGWPMSAPDKFDHGWRLAAAQGKSVAVTDLALTRLRKLDPELLAHLQTRYRLIEHRSGRLILHEAAALANR